MPAAASSFANVRTPSGDSCNVLHFDSGGAQFSDVSCDEFISNGFGDVLGNDSEFFIPLYMMQQSMQQPVQHAVKHEVHPQMPMRSDLNEKLQSLAQRLRDLSGAIICDGHTGDYSHGVSRQRRSQDQRLSMFWKSQRSTSSEPACGLAGVQPMWPPHQLHVQEGQDRRVPPDGARPDDAEGDPGRLRSQADPSGADDRGHHYGPSDGGERPPSPDRRGQNYEPQHEVGGLPQKDWRDEPKEEDHCQSARQAMSDTSARRDQGHDAIPALPRDAGISEGLSRGPENPGESGSQHGNWSRDGLGEGLTAGGGELIGGGQPQEQAEGGRSFQSLWNSLSALKDKMQKKVSRLTPETHGKGDSMAPTFQDTTSTTKSTEHPFCDAHGNSISKPDDVVRPSPKKGQQPNHLLPSVAKKIAMNAATMGALLLAPCQGLLGQLQNTPDFMEIACAPTSRLSASMEDAGYFIKRINFKGGYDLEAKSGTMALKSEMEARPPRFTWVSMPCTRLTSLQYLTPRSEEEWAKFEKRQCNDLKRSDEVAEGVVAALTASDDNDFAWEWPTRATKGWKSRAISRLLKFMQKKGRPVFWCRIDGCAYGLEHRSIPVLKGWTILTSSRKLWMSLQKRCPGHPEHAECRGVVAQASSYYPWPMVKAVTKAIQNQWSEMESKNGISLSQDVEYYLLDIKDDNTEFEGIQLTGTVREEVPEIFALTRNRYPVSPPTGKKLDEIRKMMLRVHKASGHASFTSLQRLLRARKAPPWAIEMAGKMECPSCKEAKRIPPVSVASLKELPALYEVVGMDVFEYEYSNRKFKFLLMRDRASGLVQVEFLQEYGAEGLPRSWEPKTADIINCVCRWLMVNPTPKWLITDSATYFTSMAFIDFCGSSGIGLLTTPAEAHEMLGSEEACIGVLKETVKRLLSEVPDLPIGDAFRLGANSHNQTVGPSGFSPFQWTRGSSSPHENLPKGIAPIEAFGGMLKLKEQARINYEIANAKHKISRLNNSAPKPSVIYQSGQLVMLWRQRNRPGKVTGSWLGPTRLLLVEGGTAWLATGSTLIRARLNQIRPCTSREDLQASLEGTAVMTTPTTMEKLLQSFTGRNYLNVTGEVPSERQRQDDIQAGEVLVDVGEQPRQDVWRTIVEDGRQWLIRVHHLPRLALFSPSRLQDLPVPQDKLTGRRITIVRSMLGDIPEARIEDNFKDGQDPHRHLTERWRGETRLEVAIEPTLPPSSSSKKTTVKKTISKQKNDKVKLKDDAQDASEVPVPMTPTAPGSILPQVPQLEPETPQLQQEEPSMDDDPEPPPIPEGIQGSSSEVTGQQLPAGLAPCTAPGCMLSGGHEGAHRDTFGVRYSWNSTSGRVDVDERDGSSSSTSSASSSESEELMPDEPNQNRRQRRAMKRRKLKASDLGEQQDAYQFEIALEDADVDFLTKHPMKAAIWLSKKMESKGKEARWSKLTLEEKKSFDGAQAKELSNVLTSKALRSLTASEEANLDHRKVMQMRWVLTWKSDQTAKARLVVLGYQAPNLTQVQASAPTMAKLSRNMVLAICANERFTVRAGDVTAAFLQATQSLEDEDLFVWAPAELATLFGADPSNPVKALKIQRAFYGLVHAPRKWYDHVCATLLSHGWRRLTSDGCVFVLFNGDRLVGIAGTHVDDFLLGGDDNDEVFKQAKAKLMQAYRWGKWEESTFEFAGTTITQRSDFSIEISQQNYIEKWLDEIYVSKDRQVAKKSLLTPSEISSLRGLIGTMSWKASQTGPQYVADVSLLLSEIPYATVDTLLRANKLAREMKRDSQQVLRFPSWGISWKDLAVVTWADASNHNRPDRSSTMGMISGLAPKTILEGQEVPVALVNWRSGKTPRQCLGSNGAEIQAITEGEDMTFKIRGFLIDVYGIEFNRRNLYEQVKRFTSGAVVMDSRGVFDAATRNVSALHGLRSSRAGYELALSIIQARSIDTKFRWVNGMVQLADTLTKSNSRKVLLHMMSLGQVWSVIFDEKFTAGKKIRKQEMLRKMRQMELDFFSAIDRLAKEQRWPRYDEDPRSMGDVLTELSLSA